MNSYPKISVIVPVYNAEKTLRRCVDSILHQSFTDYELLLVDDGSTDNSPEICDKYALQDTRIKVHHQQNTGVSAARNAGIEYAQGEWIMFVDSDDYIDSGGYLVDFQQYNADVVIGGVSLCGKDHTNSEIVSPENSQFVERGEFKDSLLPFMTKTYMRAPWCKLFRRSIIDDNNLRFDTEIHYAEDYLFNLQFLAVSQSLQFITTVDYIYNIPAEDRVYPIDVESFAKCTSKILNLLNEIFRDTLFPLLLEREKSVNKTLNFSQLYKYVRQLPRRQRLKEIYNFLIKCRWRYTDGNLVNKFKHAIEITRLAIK